MIPVAKRPLLLLAGLLLVVGIPLAGKWARRGALPRCAFDGLPIEPASAVRVIDQGGSHPFCCVRCARLWLGRQKNLPHAVYVTDEVGGAEINATSATFVRSSVVTNPVTGNRVHAFAEAAAAREHAAAFGGWLLEGDDRPFPRR